MPRGNPRTVQIRVNLTPEEAVALDANVAESGAPSRTAFLRAVALGPGWSSKLPAWRELALIRSELRKIGVNLNQIVAAMNKAAKAGKLTEAGWNAIAKTLNPMGGAVKGLSEKILDQLDKLKK